MESRETIRKLANKLRLAGVAKETGVTISLLLSNPGEAEQLMSWLETNPTATVEEICNKTGVIHDRSRLTKRNLG